MTLWCSNSWLDIYNLVSEIFAALVFSAKYIRKYELTFYENSTFQDINSKKNYAFITKSVWNAWVHLKITSGRPDPFACTLYLFILFIVCRVQFNHGF